MTRLSALTIPFLVCCTNTSAETLNDSLLLGVTPGSDTLTLRVVSTGCTKKEDFALTQEDDGVVTVRRMRPDRCRKKPEVIEFDYAMSDVEGRSPFYFELVPKQ